MRPKLLVPDYCQKGVHVQFLQIVGKKFCVEEDTKEAIIVAGNGVRTQPIGSTRL